jgi:hypothetical protein
MLLYDLSSFLFWGSLAELGAFAFSITLFFTDPAEMAAVWFFVVHIPRGIIGLLLIKKMPVSHQMLNKTLVKEPSKAMPFSKIKEIVTTVGGETLKEFIDQGCGKFLLIYFITTCVCFLLDIIAFFVQVSLFNAEETAAFADTGVLVMACAFIGFDLYYIAWLFASKMKFPDFMAK